MKKVAITGGLSSGKSIVCDILSQLGAYVVSADQIVHQVLLHDESVHQKIVDLLGFDVLSNHHLDRDKIAKKVFSNPEKLTSLEKIIHPSVFHEIQQQYEKHEHDPRYKLFVAEVPLLYEAQAENLFDVVVAVVAEDAFCKKRFMQKTGRSEEEYAARVDRQLSIEDKAKKADVVLTNNGSIEDLQKQINQWFPTICST